MNILLNENTTNDSFITYCNQGVKLHSAITGPIDVSRTKFEDPSKPYFDISIIPSTGVSSTQEVALGLQLNKVLSEVVDLRVYARKQLTVTVQIIDQPKDEWNTLLVDVVNGVYLACLKAGIKLSCSFWGSKVLINNHGKEISKPSNNEAISSVHRAIWGVKNGILDQLVYLDSNGEFEEQDVWSALDASGKMVENDIDQVREIVGAQVAREFIFQ